jgi:hypothetical protein
MSFLDGPKNPRGPYDRIAFLTPHKRTLVQQIGTPREVQEQDLGRIRFIPPGKKVTGPVQMIQHAYGYSSRVQFERLGIRPLRWEVFDQLHFDRESNIPVVRSAFILTATSLSLAKESGQSMLSRREGMMYRSLDRPLQYGKGVSTKTAVFPLKWRYISKV